MTNDDEMTEENKETLQRKVRFLDLAFKKWLTYKHDERLKEPGFKLSSFDELFDEDEQHIRNDYQHLLTDELLNELINNPNAWQDNFRLVAKELVGIDIGE